MSLDLPRTPRAPRSLALALTLTTMTGLTACTSDDGAEEPEEAEQTLEGSVPETGWWCRVIERELVEAVAGDRTDEAREVLRQNDTDGFHCEVTVPDDDGRARTVLTLAVAINDEARAEELRAAAEEAGAEPGPDHLGESYVWPEGTVSIVPCAAPAEHVRADEEVTYVFSLLAEEPVELTEEMVDPVRRSLIEADRAVGCRPSEAGQPDEQG